MGNWFSSGRIDNSKSNSYTKRYGRRYPQVIPKEITKSVITTQVIPHINNSKLGPASYSGPYDKEHNTTNADSNRSVNLRQPLIGPQPVNLQYVNPQSGNPQSVVNSSNSNNGRRVNISRRPSTGTTYSVVNEPELDGGSRSKKNKRTRKNHKKGL